MIAIFCAGTKSLLRLKRRDGDALFLISCNCARKATVSIFYAIKSTRKSNYQHILWQQKLLNNQKKEKKYDSITFTSTASFCFVATAFPFCLHAFSF
jgi:hypothetical protein